MAKKDLGLPNLVVTKGDGVPLPNQKAALVEFEAACKESQHMLLTQALTEQLRPVCPRCKGEGTTESIGFVPETMVLRSCSVCKGAGQIWLAVDDLTEMVIKLRQAISIIITTEPEIIIHQETVDLIRRVLKNGAAA